MEKITSRILVFALILSIFSQHADAADRNKAYEVALVEVEDDDTWLIDSNRKKINDLYKKLQVAKKV